MPLTIEEIRLRHQIGWILQENWEKRDAFGIIDAMVKLVREEVRRNKPRRKNVLKLLAMIFILPPLNAAPKKIIDDVKPGKYYRINADCDYFLKKYGERNPVIRVRGGHREFLHGWWGNTKSKYAYEYAGRVKECGLPVGDKKDKTVFWGHIDTTPELIHWFELEEIRKEKNVKKKIKTFAWNE